MILNISLVYSDSTQQAQKHDGNPSTAPEPFMPQVAAPAQQDARALASNQAGPLEDFFAAVNQDYSQDLIDAGLNVIEYDNQPAPTLEQPGQDVAGLTQQDDWSLFFEPFDHVGRSLLELDPIHGGSEIFDMDDEINANEGDDTTRSAGPNGAGSVAPENEDRPSSQDSTSNNNGSHHSGSITPPTSNSITPPAEDSSSPAPAYVFVQPAPPLVEHEMAFLSAPTVLDNVWPHEKERLAEFQEKLRAMPASAARNLLATLSRLGERGEMISLDKYFRQY
jgi:hypothetical protein